MSRAQLQHKSEQLSQLLLDELNPEGFWSGELSSSALAVAVAVAALHFHDADRHAPQIQLGLEWLQQQVNADGSFGDTVDSPGNVSTSLLVYAALNLYPANRAVCALQSKTEKWLLIQGIDVRSEEIIQVILTHYKNDYTFSVPILTLCGLCGVPGPKAFQFIPQLPYELALLPRKFYRFLKLSVVSYAIPALVAVGIVVYKKKRTNWFWRAIRHFSIQPALKRLERMMPASGGFLEAIPLTAFVSLSLINAGFRDHPVVTKGISFLKNTQRSDGGWAIDVDLSTWVTTLSVKALRQQADGVLSAPQKRMLVQHLLDCQTRAVHPFNGSQPGGWGWTSFPGSVPDGDDTPGAMLALMQLDHRVESLSAVVVACRWLKDLQNSDGGFPTFSRGWGKLPFDQSCCDLTGHCVLALAMALNRCQSRLTASERAGIQTMLNRAINYLEHRQQADGSWLPLWFGNQRQANHANPVYGTARVACYLSDALCQNELNGALKDKLAVMISKARSYLVVVQNADGSWGGDGGIPGSIEETALAVSALAGKKTYRQACTKAMAWLHDYEQAFGLTAAPIGLYFASLWYHEKLYPVTCYLEAVNRLLLDEPG
ncbi:prenyltransferase/squalene oxidase repeat-containing protein [Mangrovibacterium sp.]|uniref:prenyltransferase/squalene oxidase repeat-containing protein n=1 Tax=Mangrovibacterium sp. TaxID=1961364 RepID=UPI003566F65F